MYSPQPFCYVKSMPMPPSPKITDGDAGLEAVAKNSEKFAGNYVKKLAKCYPGNLITSPISTQTYLAMVSYGANSRTSTLMRTALRVPRGIGIGQSGYRSVIETLNSIRGAELRLANKLYTASYITVKPLYEQLVMEKFYSSCQSVNFNKPTAAAKAINNWCEEQTNRRIKTIVSAATLPPDAQLVLLNAVYFKGFWERKFDSTLTKPKPFYLDENNVKRVPTMFIMRRLRTGELPNLGARIVELPYEGGSVSMVIVIPNQINGLVKILENLDKVNIQQRLQAGSEQYIELYLPKFKIKKELDLNPVLQELGMTNMFHTTANFSGITDTTPVFVTKVLQAAYIEVNEEGSDAVPYARHMSGYGFNVPPPPPPEFRVDRPFYFVILHRSTGVQLFSGVVHQPSSR